MRQRYTVFLVMVLLVTAIFIFRLAYIHYEFSKTERTSTSTESSEATN